MLRLEEAAPSAPVETAREALSGLSFDQLGIPAGQPLRLVEPIARFIVQVEDLLRSRPISRVARRWGWRFFIVSSDHAWPVAIDVRPGRDAGDWQAGLAKGPSLAAQLKALDRLSGGQQGKGVLRLLEAPGLDWSGLWVSGETDRLFALGSSRSASAASVLARLRKTARRHPARDRGELS